MSKKVMKLLDASTGLMECRVCGRQHHASLLEGGRYARGSWKCSDGCKHSDLRKVKVRLAGGELSEFRLVVGAGIPVLENAGGQIYGPGDIRFSEILFVPAWAEDLLRWAGYQF